MADAAQPLHNSIHHDGWSGDDPKGYTRDPNIHGRFESQYVEGPDRGDRGRCRPI